MKRERERERGRQRGRERGRKERERGKKRERVRERKRDDVCWFLVRCRPLRPEIACRGPPDHGTSARELISFSRIQNLPDFTTDALTPPQFFPWEVFDQAFLSCAAQPRVFRRLVSWWLRSALSQLPEGLPCNGCVLLVSCFLVGFLYSRCSCVLGWCLVLSVFFVVDHGEQLSEWVDMCPAPWFHVPWFMECDGCVNWRICVVALQFFWSERLHISVIERLLLLCASHAHSVSLGYRCFRDKTDFLVRTLNHVVPSASMIWLYPWTLLNLLNLLPGLVSQVYLLSVAEHCFQPSVSFHGVRVVTC